MTLPAGPVGLHALREEQPDALVREHALHHREALADELSLLSTRALSTYR